MRRTFRQLAAVKPAQYLEAGAPTGITGLRTNASPRSALLYLYSQTLDKLSQIPETSLYRQSTEAVTKHRMAIANAIVPEGQAAWKAKTDQLVKDHPEIFAEEKEVGGHNVSISGKVTKETHGGKTFFTTKPERKAVEAEGMEWDGEPNLQGGIELGGHMHFEAGTEKIELPPQPRLTAQQVSEMENQIGAGLIEEVIEVAEGELKLVDVMLKAKVWEDLVEKPVEGQWEYFMRGPPIQPAQPPPQK
ncbi:NADH-ubiquinone oxidoreductase 29.9 kDa subunit [Venustampulla echinocandica]|uniref:NADH-ubiquinone oxidoreductase 29.9 kDa subunit n=1 Tax=Venustampulla echinocandica TaxID=2656787 RepID=A0A370TFF3_9HELO|nr:NADH-ubiquinone oxidoreductase 29.9 kDa subunit [Venustampulla echinocandica]RDL33628.1 NADH-ubiquinone oxidoreductase 29.9 kDa subunit [Venustampulla echinocandica]